MQHEEADWKPHQWRTPKFKTADTTLCKDMLYQTDRPQVYNKKLKQAIQSSTNPIVFMKGDSVSSFLSMVSLQLMNLNEHFNFRLKDRLSTKAQIDNFSEQILKSVAKEVLGTSKSYFDLTQFATQQAKPFVEIHDQDLQANPKGELNKVLASWGKEELTPDQDMRMSGVVNVGLERNVGEQTIGSSYQIGVRDPWDTAKGDVFSPADVAKTHDERIDAMVTRYVPEPMQSYFAQVLRSYGSKIASKVEAMEANYASNSTSPAKEEL